jgi:CRISPR/Cas system-associated exonuclease Cas4 (RecB family)
MEFGGKYKVRERGLYDPVSTVPFSISRSKIENFLECPRCSYLDLCLGITRPETPSFTLNNAVDELLKKEFDIHRANGTTHPLMKTYGLKAKPLKHPDLSTWRDARFNGVKYVHAPTNFLVRGGIDDVWQDEEGNLLVVDYKATSKRKEIELYAAYKRQAEVYQWLFRQNGFKVSDNAYFVYVNGKTDVAAFDGKLEFDVELILHQGNDAWIEPTLFEIHKTIQHHEPPPRGARCDYCPYREAAGKALFARTKKPVVSKPTQNNHAATLF